MIKMHYKKIISLAFALALVSGGNVWAVPSETAAERQADRQAAREEKQAERQENLCEKISDLADKFSGNLGGEENRYRERFEERENNWENKLAEREAELERLRQSWDENFEQQISKLKEKATTDEQKAAVTQFETTVRAAIATRRAAVDAARNTFQEGVKNAISTRQAEIEGLVSSTKSARTAAFEKAKSDCAAGVNAVTVRANLRSTLKEARLKIQTERKNSEKIGTTVNSLVTARRASFEKAFSDFKATMEQARTTLKKAFSGTTDTTTSN